METEILRLWRKLKAHAAAETKSPCCGENQEPQAAAGTKSTQLRRKLRAPSCGGNQMSQAAAQFKSPRLRRCGVVGSALQFSISPAQLLVGLSGLACYHCLFTTVVGFETRALTQEVSLRSRLDRAAEDAKWHRKCSSPQPLWLHEERRKERNSLSLLYACDARATTCGPSSMQ